MKAHGTVRLRGARLNSSFVLDGAELAADGTNALHADQLVVAGSLSGNELRAKGAVRLPGARIEGQRLLDGATITNPHGRSLHADGLVVGAMLCRALQADGSIRLREARIGIELNVEQAKLATKDEPALDAQRMAVEGSVLGQGLEATGGINLYLAHVRGDLDLNGAVIASSNSRPALLADGLRVDSLMLCQLLDSKGEIRLTGAQLAGGLNFVDATLANPDGTCLDLAWLEALRLSLRFAAQPVGEVNLINARVGELYDNRETWPELLHLRGFSYDSLARGFQSWSAGSSRRRSWRR